MAHRSRSPRAKTVGWILIAAFFVTQMLLVAFSPRGSVIRSVILVVDAFVLIGVIVSMIVLVRRGRRSS